MKTAQIDTGPHRTKNITAIVKKLVAAGFGAAVFAVIWLPVALADIEEYETDVGSVHNFGQFVTQVWGWGSQVVFATAVIGIIVGGIMMVASGGNEDRADMGRETVHGGVIAILITLMSGGAYKLMQSANPDREEWDIRDLIETLMSAANSLLTVVGGASAVALVYTGIKYMTSGGDEEKLDSAKSGLKYAIIGLVVSVSAYGILNFLLDNFGS